MIEFGNIVTRNEKMQSAVNVAKRIAGSDISVLLVGETGVGKKTLAQAIHNFSPRHDEKFVHLNCSTIPGSLMDAELFGIFDKQKSKNRKGKFELANKGTLFLDAIEYMDLNIQTKVLEAIESKRFLKSDDEEQSFVDVRLISATSENLIEKVEKSLFRMDFYYRIREIFLEIPPLRERKEDISFLIDYFIKQFSNDFGKKISGISDVALQFLLSHEWKGNVRELRNMMRTAVALCEKDKIWLEDIPLKVELGKESNTKTIDMEIESFSLKEVERLHILKTLNHCRWNKSKAAKLLQVSRPRLDRKIDEYSLRKPDKKGNK